MYVYVCIDQFPPCHLEVLTNRGKVVKYAACGDEHSHPHRGKHMNIIITYMEIEMFMCCCCLYKLSGSCYIKVFLERSGRASL